MTAHLSGVMRVLSIKSIRVGNGYYHSMMIWYASFLHCFWAMIIMFHEAPINTTATYGLYFVFDGFVAPILIISSVLPIFGFYFVESKIWAVFCMLPQQSILVISAFIAVRAIYLGQFPDGVMRSPWFIAVDQAPAILAAVFYSLAVITAVRRA